MPKKQNPEQGGGVRGVDLAEVERLLAFMQKHELEEFEYERAGVHIRLKKASARSAGRQSAPGASGRLRRHYPAFASATCSFSPPSSRERTSTLQKRSAVGADVHIVKSPIVGTFYSAPGPEASPFVTLGAKVNVGQVLCIIEAMKLMNEIESDAAGEIVNVFVENGKPVEYGERLFGIRPQAKK